MGQSAKHSRQPATLYDHIRELQMRFLMSAVAMAIGGAVVYAYYAQVLAILSSPLNAPLYYSSPAGGFSFIMKICFTGALIIAIPVIAYNLIMFIRPAFKKHLPMKRVFMTAGFSTILAIAGALFAFYCILPGTLSFFKGFQVNGLSALISADNYLGFVTNIIIMFVIVFQIPLVIAFIDRIKPLQPKKLLKMEKWVILGSLIVALLAPFTYDLVTSLLIALPIVVLYNLSIVMVVARHARIAHKAKATIHMPVVESVVDTTPVPELAVADQNFGFLADEPVVVEQPVAIVETTSEPVAVIAKAIKPIPVYKPVVKIVYTGVAMDVKRGSKQPAPAQQPAWVLERKMKKAMLMEQARRFSEINRAAGVKRVATS